MRALGLDLGSRRIGVAISDSAGAVAVPYEVLQRTGDRPREHRRIRDLAAEAEAEIVVVGIPYSLDGSCGPAARRYLAEVRELERTLELPVVTHDERLSTASAHRSLAAAEVPERARRQVVDKVAAAVILQSWLDLRRSQQGQRHSRHDLSPATGEPTERGSV
jgi:putative holliday junction resolvase